MEWNTELIMEFINLYEKHPVLWDPKHSNHKNRNSLNDAWLDIASEFSIDVTVELLRKKKNHLWPPIELYQEKYETPKQLDLEPRMYIIHHGSHMMP